jgi:hypothetical protein
MDHLMAEKEQNNKDSQKGQVTPKQFFKDTNKKNFTTYVSIFDNKYSLKYIYFQMKLKG